MGFCFIQKLLNKYQRISQMQLQIQIQLYYQLMFIFFMKNLCQFVFFGQVLMFYIFLKVIIFYVIGIFIFREEKNIIQKSQLDYQKYLQLWVDLIVVQLIEILLEIVLGLIQIKWFICVWYQGEKLIQKWCGFN